MVDTPYYGVTHIDEDQNNKEVTANAAFDRFAEAFAATHVADFAAGDVALTAAEWHEHLRFAAASLTVDGRKLTIPASEGRWAIIDNTAGTVALEVVQGATTVVVGRGQVAVIHTDGTTDDLELAGEDRVPLDFHVEGAVPATTVLYRKIAAEPFWLADDFAGSAGAAGTPASGSPAVAIVLDVEIDGVKIGEISFADSASTATFSTSASPPGREYVDAGEVLSVVSPATINGLADIAVALLARRG
jgi:hypothetical protein